MVRKLLRGKFANTAFAVFNPTGTKQLSRAGRSPDQGLGNRGDSGDKAIILQMNRIANQFKPSGDSNQALLQDFNSLRQALNVASADQRLLVYVNAAKNKEDAEKKLRPVIADAEIVGKFHVDFADAKSDKGWTKVINGAKDEPSILIVYASQFGLDGKAVAQLSLESSPDEIKAALTSANEKFAKVEKRKDYATHVQAGRRQGVYFKNEIPYGEDRDGDGTADKKSRGKGRGGR